MENRRGTRTRRWTNIYPTTRFHWHHMATNRRKLLARDWKNCWTRTIPFVFTHPHIDARGRPYVRSERRSRICMCARRFTRNHGWENRILGTSKDLQRRWGIFGSRGLGMVISSTGYRMESQRQMYLTDVLVSTRHYSDSSVGMISHQFWF